MESTQGSHRYQTALVLFNPKSGSFDLSTLKQASDKLKALGKQITLTACDSIETMRAHIEQSRAAYDIIFIGGGDGTLSAVADLFHKHPITLGVLPLGTANDLARSLGIPLSIPEAMALLHQGKTHSIDLGKVNDTFFFNVAHIGLGADMSVHLDKHTKKRWGPFSYARTLSVFLKNIRSFKAYLHVDERMLKTRTIQISVGNGRFFGGGNIVDDEAYIDDGRLALFSICHKPWWKLVLMAPLVRLGKLKLDTQTLTLRAQRIEISTSRPKRMYADGEYIGKTPARFSIAKRAVDVLVPQSLPNQ